MVKIISLLTVFSIPIFIYKAKINIRNMYVLHLIHTINLAFKNKVI